MKNLFSKSLMMAAAAMMFVSCSNEEEVVVNAPATTNEVSIALSVKGTRTASADMNFDGTANIKNVAVVPYVTTLAQKPVCWETITKDQATTNPEAKKTQMLSSVNLFKVYGNLTGDQYAKVNDGTFNLTAADLALKARTELGYEAYYACHPALYYFKSEIQFKVATQGANWAGAIDWTTNSGSIGDAKYVKIEDVNYAVASLAVSVMNDAENIFLKETGSVAESVDAAVKVTGIVVRDQKNFDLDFNLTGDPLDVYETAVKEGFGTKINNKDDATNGNIFAILSPSETGERVKLAIEFEVKEGYKFTDLNNIEHVAGDRFFLNMQLSPATYEVFQADYLTKVNATVKNWGLATEEPEDVTDAEIGVVFDVDWEEGNLYEVEL